MRAALYARVSTERQERFQTIDSQLAALRAWAAAGGHALADEHVFRDEGYSGGRLDRPGLDALRDAVRDGAVGIVAVLTPDRLARKYAYQVLLLEEFRRAGCEVAFLQHPISDDPNDQLLLQIQGAIAEYERAVLGERFRRGKLQKARDGHYQGGCAPYGYRYVPRQDAVPGHLVVDEREAELVRTLYGWLTDERTTIRQILKRLNAGPHFPRSGRHPWSASLVHHVLADPVYAGTAYANRYRFVPAKKPRSARGPRTGEATCRQLKPREQWIGIPVPAIIDTQTWDRAQAQLARNAALSFRNNTKHNYLLRCLMTCSSCGLAMFGRTYIARGRQPERRYYMCHGKDCIMSARPAACPSRNVKADEIEAAVWGHVAELLASPDRMMAQFDRFSAAAESGTTRDRAADQRLRARLDRVARADKRLLDAYQAGAISLAELSERRRHLHDERLLLERQQREADELRRQRVQAQAVRASLEAFCDRTRARLDAATFADKQAILQLVVERIIVGDGRLEIRHVIPLRPPQPGSDGPVQPDAQLRSDRVHAAPLPGRAHHPPDRALQPLVGIRDHQLDAAQAAPDQGLEKRAPERLGLRRADVQAHHLPLALGVHGHGDYGRHAHDPPALALLEVGRVEPEIGPLARERAVEEGVHALVDVAAQLAHRALANARQPHRLHEVVHLARRHAADPRFLDHRHQRPLGGLPRLQEGREVGRAAAQLGNAQLERAEPGVERAVAEAVAIRRALAGPFVATRADQPFHVRLHQELHHGLGHRTQEVLASGLLHQLGQWQCVAGHRVSCSVRDRASQLHPRPPVR
jgi:site-specific DNA recombinase